MTHQEFVERVNAKGCALHASVVTACVGVVHDGVLIVGPPCMDQTSGEPNTELGVTRARARLVEWIEQHIK